VLHLTVTGLDGEEADVIASHFESDAGKEQLALMDWFLSETVLFRYTYTNQFGCTSTDTTTAKVSACDERNRSLEAGGAILYPNPNGGQFNIRVNSTRFQFLQMRVYNALGQLVSTKQWNGLVFGQIMPVDMRHLAAGVYTVRIIYDGGNLYEDRGYQMLITH
jgi:hypothetical protein